MLENPLVVAMTDVEGDDKPDELSKKSTPKQVKAQFDKSRRTKTPTPSKKTSNSIQRPTKQPDISEVSYDPYDDYKPPKSASPPPTLKPPPEIPRSELYAGYKKPSPAKPQRAAAPVQEKPP